MWRLLALSTLSVALAAAGGAAAKDKGGYSPAWSACMDKANTTLFMDQCNRAELKRRDAALNAAFQHALAKMPSEETRRILREAEAKWIAFRDADCALYGDRNGFGTMGVVEGGACLIERTMQRTHELEALAPGNDE